MVQRTSKIASDTTNSRILVWRKFKVHPWPNTATNFKSKKYNQGCFKEKYYKMVHYNTD